jgi:hypothetical protein
LLAAVGIGRTKPEAGGSNSLIFFRVGSVCFAFVQNQFRQPQRRVRPADARKFFRHSCHRFALCANASSTSSGTSRLRSATAPNLYSRDELRVAFFLAGNDLVDDHRAAGGNRLLHDRAARLADDQMMRSTSAAASGSSSPAHARGL